MCFGTYSHETIYSELSKLKEKKPLEKYTTIQLREQLKSDPYWIFCPHETCPVGGNFIGTCGREILTCQSCTKPFCSQCSRNHSANEPCPQDNSEESKLSEEWKQANAKRCPSCKYPISKYIGCDHITCVNCKYEFCYLCLSSYYDGHIRESHGPPNQGVVTRTARRIPITMSHPLSDHQLESTTISPAPILLVNAQRLHRQRIDVSLIDSNNRIVPVGLTKTETPLRVAPSSVTFDNLLLATVDHLEEQRARSGASHIYRLRFDLAGETIYSNTFEIGRS